MAANVTIVAGPARSGKTRRMLDQFRKSLAGGLPGCALWLGPNARSVARLRGQLLGPSLTACSAPQCFTFRQLGSRVLEALGAEERPLSDLGKSRMLARLIEQGLADNQLVYFARVAQTPGFLQLVSQSIGQWKQLEIWPEDLAGGWQQGAATRRQRELLWLYIIYQQQLQQHRLFDAEGQFWLARTLLASSVRQVFPQLQAVFVDGFADFTRTELDVLQSLSNHVGSLCISLPLDFADAQGGLRNDLFGKPLRTLAELNKRFPDSRSVALDRRPTTFTSLDFWEANLFRLKVPLPPKKLPNFCVFQAAGELAELDGIARRIKQLLQTGDAQPQQVMVVFRSLADRASLIRDVFARHGVPAHVDAPQPVGNSAVAAGLLAWLKLLVEDWPYRQLLVMLSHNSFAPDWTEWHGGMAALDAEMLIRELQVPQGCRTILAQLERLSARLPQTSEPTTAARRLTSGTALLKKLAAVVDHLPERATGTQWATALTLLANELGLYKLVLHDPREQAAWDAMIASLLDFDQLSRWLDEDRDAGLDSATDDNVAGRELSLAEVDQLLQEVALSATLPHATTEVGRVLVTHAGSARSLSAKHVFLAGLDERSYPAALSDGGLLDEAQRAQLAKSGLPFITRDQRSQDEMLLFYEVLTRATKSITLSYPGLDAKAQPLNCSPFLSEMQRLAGDAWIASKQVEEKLDPIPSADEVTSARDARIFGLYRALEHDVQPLAAWQARFGVGGAGENLRHALIAQASRTQSQTFGLFEGIFASPAVRKKLAERFGADRVWSASQLEEFAYCPYKFLLGKVLRIEPLADLSLETDFMQRGSIVHGVLAELHRRLNQQHGAPVSPASLPEDEYAAQCAAVLDEVLSRMPASQPFAKSLLTVERAVIYEWLMHYRKQHADYDGLFVKTLQQSFAPTHFEYEFGPPRVAADDDGIAVPGDDASQAEPLRITNPGSGEVLKLAGRVDRIDVAHVDGRMLYNIIDYKSGKTRAVSDQRILDGDALQLPLYALAVEQLLYGGESAAPWQAGYWQVKGKGYPPKSGYSFSQMDGTDGVVPTDQWQSTRQELVELLFGLVQSLRAGEFPMHCADEHCTGKCEFRTVCRVAQVRSRGKVWHHAGDAIPVAATQPNSAKTSPAKKLADKSGIGKAPSKRKGTP
jgi:ATP-dependent helicase/DNAse subunit B